MTPEIPGWQLLDTEVVYDGTHLVVHRDRVRLPGDGREGSYEHITVGDGARVVALDGDGRVALVEDAFYLSGERRLLVPGGGIDPGEPPEQGAARELEEEAGHRPGRLDHLATIDPLPTTTRARTHLYLATDLRPGTPHRDPTEAAMRVLWWPLAQAVAAVLSGRIQEAGSVAALLLAERRVVNGQARDTG